MQVHVNPLISWVWFGVAVMMIGTLIAFIPERAFAFAASRVPSASDVVTTTTSLLLLVGLLLSPVSVAAQETGLVDRSTAERDLENEIMCNCGGCHLPVGTCGMPNCHGKSGQYERLRKYLGEGKSRDEVLAAFVRDFGSEDILAQPPNRGFNRLAWMLPYGAALAGIAVVGVMAVRWTRKDEAGPDRAGAPPRRDLEDRLDDELRELD